MYVVGYFVELALWAYLLLLIARLVVDWVQMFARGWSPRGMVLFALEVVYSGTDPPIQLLRRVIPPFRIGGMALDVSIMIVILLVILGRVLNRELILEPSLT